MFAFVDVPDFAKAAFSLTGIALAMTPARPNAPAGAFADLMPMTPTTERSFAKDGRVSAFFKVQQAGNVPQPVAVHIQIAASDGRIVFDEARSLTPADFATARAAAVSVDLPLSRLVAGEYLLVVQASIGSDQLRRNVRFSVR